MPDTSAARDTSSVAETKIRTVRVSDAVWDAAKATAYEERDTLTTVILFALSAYAKDPTAYKRLVTSITHRELMSEEDLDVAAASVWAQR